MYYLNVIITLDSDVYVCSDKTLITLISSTNCKSHQQIVNQCNLDECISLLANTSVTDEALRIFYSLILCTPQTVYTVVCGLYLNNSFIAL